MGKYEFKKSWNKIANALTKQNTKTWNKITNFIYVEENDETMDEQNNDEFMERMQ